MEFLSIFQRGTLKDYLDYKSRMVIQLIKKDTHSRVGLEKHICYAAARNDKIGITLFADEEYPSRVAIELTLKIHDNFKDFMIQNKLI